MLRIYLDENRSSIDGHIIADVENEFRKVRLQNTHLTRSLLRQIEKGRYDTEITFIDRFGVRLYTSELSTGCKAALLTEYRTDFVIDTVECGFNARDAIIQNCKTGSVIIYNTGRTFIWLENDACDVCMDGYRFKTISRLNRYIQNEEWDPDYADLSDLEKV